MAHRRESWLRWLGRHPLLWLVPLAIAVKAAFVLSLADVFQYGEELEKGTAAKAMLDGLDVPHHQLAYHYYEGGGFVASHLKALCFALVGENVLAHKLVALYFVVLVLCAGIALARELFGERASVWFGLLYVFGPASFQKLSAISLGIHFEACLFLLLVLCITARIVFREGVGAWHFGLLGLFAGFGVYFSYQVVVVAAYAGLWLVARRPRRVFGTGGLWGLAGFALGAAPLWIMYALVGDQVFDIHGTSLAGGAKAVGTGERLGAFLSSLYRGRGSLDLAGPVVWPLSVLVAVGVALFAAGEGARAFRTRFAFVAGYVALFLAVYLSSNFVVGKVLHFFYLLRFAPLWIAGTLLVAAAIDRLGRRAGVRARASRLALAWVPLSLGVASSVAIVLGGQPGAWGENWEVLTRTKGYLYAEYFAKLVPHLAGDDAAKLQVLLGFEEPARDWLRANAASELFLDPTPDLPAALERARGTVARLEPARVEEYELGLGPLLLRAAGWDLVAALEQASLAPPELRARLIEALGRTVVLGHPRPEALLSDLAAGAVAADGAAFARGTGWRLQAGTRFRPDRARAALAELPATEARAVREGYEQAVRAHSQR